jgi:predicted flap endonuclease-1-like 5' DNA nuclease
MSAPTIASVAKAGHPRLKEEGMTKLMEIEGVGRVNAQTLKKAGVRSVEGLLQAGATPAGRKKVAKEAGFSTGTILQWVNHVDLFRIKGIGSEYSDLLEAAGVDSVMELKQRRPAALLEKMTAFNARKKLVRRLPTLSMVTRWVAQAKKLPRRISY